MPLAVGDSDSAAETLNVPSRASSKASSSLRGGSSSSAASAPNSGSAGPIPIELSQHESLEWARSSIADPSNLRHLTEYERIRTLGRGAFGTTHLVRNIVDSRLYALKCIILGSKEQFGTEACKRVLREVDALSSLKSDNVVSYYGAWIERGAMETEDELSTIQGEVTSSYTGESDSYTNYSLSSSGRVNYGTNNAIKGDETPCECNLCHRHYNDWEVSFENWGLLDTVLQPLDLCTNCYKKSIPLHIDTDAIVIREKRQILPECLYILMGYAGHDLSAEIDSMVGGKSDADTTKKRRWSLFAQYVQGLLCIHQAGFAHRDIKCTNLFVNDNVATIGDLGLASVSTASNDTGVGNTVANQGASASSDVGTWLYSAPEIITGKYDEKCDIYSLGIVLIELFSYFGTGMERIKILTKIREEGDIDENDVALDTMVLELARSMINHSISKRPSCSKILEYLVENDLPARPDPSVLMKMVKDLRCEVERLRGLLDSNGIDH